MESPFLVTHVSHPLQHSSSWWFKVPLSRCEGNYCRAHKITLDGMFEKIIFCVQVRVGEDSHRNSHRQMKGPPTS